MPTKRLSNFLSTYSSRGFSEKEKVGWQEKFMAQIIATSAEVKGVLSKGIPIHPQKKSLNSALGSNLPQIHSVGEGWNRKISFFRKHDFLTPQVSMCFHVIFSYPGSLLVTSCPDCMECHPGDWMNSSTLWFWCIYKPITNLFGKSED